jgi:hypothetical protein
MPSIPQAFLNFKEFINFYITWSDLSGGVIVYSFEKIVNWSFDPPAMVVVTQVMGC